MKKFALIYSEYTPTIDAIKFRLDGISEIDTYTKESDFTKYDLVAAVNYNGEIKQNILKVHYSLLPAFECPEPIKHAMLAGVKVTGITVFYSETKQIVAQYPIFIQNGMHYDELLQECKYLEQTIYPLVIEKILKKETFEIRDLASKNSCSGNCAGCGKCSN